MKMRPIQVTEEYLDTLCDWMLEWVAKESSLTVPQFIAEKGLGYPYLKYFAYCSPKVENTFEVMKAILHCRWIQLGMSQTKLPPHRAKMLMRYLRFYDSHALDVEDESKKAIAEATAVAEMQFTAEQYAKERLEQPFDQLYEQNDNKRRDSKKAE